MSSPETEPSKQEIEISPVTEVDLIELRKNPPTSDDITNLEVEIGRNSDGSKIHKVPEFVYALNYVLSASKEHGWSDDFLTDFETMRRKIRVMLKDPLKYIKQ